MAGETSVWRPSGAWYGGTVVALALSPAYSRDGIVLAATAAGLYRSTDGGRHWLCSQDGLTDPRVLTVVFAATMALAFAATADGRLFQSEDGGATWLELTSWAGLGQISAIAVSPNFVQDRTLFLGTQEGIFRSQDGGQSWESSTFGLLDLEILCLACAPTFAEDEVLWAGSAQGGLYRSRNGARSWRDAGQGLPDTAMQCLAVSPNFAVDQTLYVGTESDGLYRSTDGGAHWQAVTPTLAGQSVNALAISVDGQTLFAGAAGALYCSTDGGVQWVALPNSAFLTLALAVAPDGTALVGAYGTGVLHVSATAGQWQPVETELAAHAPPLALFAQDATLYLLDVEGKLGESQDIGRTWRLVNDDLAGEPVLAATVTSTHEGAFLYAATPTQFCRIAWSNTGKEATIWLNDQFLQQNVLPMLLVCSPGRTQRPVLVLADATSRLYRSIDGGLQWTALTSPWSNSQLLQLGFSPDYHTNQTLYALTTQPHREHHHLLQLWQTSDDGNAWLVQADFYAETPAAVMTLPHDPSEQAILVGVRNRLIKIYQQPGGQDWVVNQQFLADTLRITGIVTTDNYHIDRVIYVTTNSGLLYGRADTATWQPVGAGLAERTIVAFRPATDTQPAIAVELGGTIWQG